MRNDEGGRRKDWWKFSSMVRPCGENDRIAKRFYVRKCAGNSSVGRPRKKWIDTVKECLKKRGLNAWRIGHDRSVCRRFVSGESMGVARGMNSWLWQDATVFWSPTRAKVRLWPSLQLKGIKGKISFFISFNSTYLLFSLISWNDAWRPRGGENWLMHK